MASDKDQKEVKTNWPIEEGITDFETQTQVGRTSNLVIQEGSKVLSRNTVLL